MKGLLSPLILLLWLCPTALLIAAGAAVDRMGGVYTHTALMYASSAGHTEIVRLLLAAGADPHLRTRSGQTALDMSRIFQHSRITALLKSGHD